MRVKKDWEFAEKDVCRIIPCLKCGEKMILLSRNFPVIDAKCCKCDFVVQIKNSKNSPEKIKTILGSGYKKFKEFIDSSGSIPPMIVNCVWFEDKVRYQKIIYYSEIPEECIKDRVLSSKARRANHHMFNFIRMEKVPYKILFENKF